MINEIFRQVRPGADVESSSDLVADYALDSLDAAVIIAEIEKRYNISIKIEDINVDNLRTKQTILDMIERNGNI